MSHVSGIWPVERHDDAACVLQIESAFVSVPTCPMPPPKMVMTTSAAIRMTMAETTTASVVFIESL